MKLSIIALPLYLLLCVIDLFAGYEKISSVISPGGEWLNGGEYSLRGSIAEPISNVDPSRSSGYANRTGYYNPAYFAFQKKLPVIFSNSEMSINIPSESVDKETFDLYYNDNINEISQKDKVDTANNKAVLSSGNFSLPIKVGEIYFMDEETRYSSLSKPGNISFKIQDIDNDGNVDDSNPPIRLNTISGYMLNSEYSLWMKAFENNFDRNSLLLSFAFNRTGIYGILGQIDDSVKDVFVYPVPFRPNGPSSGFGSGKTGDEEHGITFANIPQSGYIEIYTIDGRLVRKIDIPQNLVEPKISWSVKNSEGNKVASGVYIWRIISGKNSKTGKLIVIR